MSNLRGRIYFLPNELFGITYHGEHPACLSEGCCDGACYVSQGTTYNESNRVIFRQKYTNTGIVVYPNNNGLKKPTLFYKKTIPINCRHVKEERFIGYMNDLVFNDEYLFEKYKENKNGEKLN